MNKILKSKNKKKQLIGMGRSQIRWALAVEVCVWEQSFCFWKD